MGGYILAILSRIILKQGNIWDIQKVKQKGYLNKNLKQKENEMDKNKLARNWEEIPDEDLWEDGEIRERHSLAIKIYEKVIVEGKWKLIRRIK